MAIEYVACENGMTRLLRDGHPFGNIVTSPSGVHDPVVTICYTPPEITEPYYEHFVQFYQIPENVTAVIDAMAALEYRPF